MVGRIDTRGPCLSAELQGRGPTHSGYRIHTASDRRASVCQVQRPVHVRPGNRNAAGWNECVKMPTDTLSPESTVNSQIRLNYGEHLILVDDRL